MTLNEENLADILGRHPFLITAVFLLISSFNYKIIDAFKISNQALYKTIYVSIVNIFLSTILFHITFFER